MANKSAASDESLLQRLKRELIREKSVLFSLIILTFIILTTIIATTLLNTYETLATNILAPRLQPPSLQNWLGTDSAGRDNFHVLFFAIRNSLIMMSMTTILAGIFGVIYGLVAGYIGGWIDYVMVLIVDAISLFPVMILAIAILIFIPGTMMFSYPITIALISWPQVAKVVRDKVIEEKNMDYIEAARTIGTNHKRIIFSHLLPNLLVEIVASMTLVFATVAVIEAGLSFLDFGFATVVPTIGTLISPPNNPADGAVMMMPGGSMMIFLRNYENMWIPPVVILVTIIYNVNKLAGFILRFGNKGEG